MRDLLLPTNPSYSLLASFGGSSRPDIMADPGVCAVATIFRGFLLHSTILNLAIVAHTDVELVILLSAVTYGLYHSILFQSATRLTTLRRSSWVLATVYAHCRPRRFPDLIQTLSSTLLVLSSLVWLTHSMVHWFHSFHSSAGGPSPRLVMTFDCA